LIGVENSFTFLLIETNTKDILYEKNEMEIEDNSKIPHFETMWNSKPKEEIQQDFNFHYMEIIKKM